MGGLRAAGDLVLAPLHLGPCRRRNRRGVPLRYRLGSSLTFSRCRRAYAASSALSGRISRSPAPKNQLQHGRSGEGRDGAFARTQPRPRRHPHRYKKSRRAILASTSRVSQAVSTGRAALLTPEISSPERAKPTDTARLAYTRARVAHWDQTATRPTARAWSRAYHARLA